MSFTRRHFVRNGAGSAFGAALVPRLLTRAVFDSSEMVPATRRLIVVFQRGAADGLSMVVPHGDAQYYAMRPNINIPRESVLDLDGFFGLHPSLAAFQPLWKQRHLAIVHAAGSPHSTRSHFEAQDFMETGTPGVKASGDGWLNRVLHNLPPAPQHSAFRAIGMDALLPRILSGANPAVAINSTHDFFDSGKYNPAPGANYPETGFGDDLRRLAQLMKENPGLQVAFADIAGWDHHVDEGRVEGPLAEVLSDFSQSLAAFWIDLGDLGEDTVVVTMSEFGRTVRENENQGTDHGHANVMFVLGGAVKGGKVYGRWPGLDPSQLYQGRDLALTTDFRQVVGEVVARHLKNQNLAAVFPGYDNQPGRFLNIFEDGSRSGFA
jgi:uncharacterized protein (DUF1501 family)